MALRCRRKNFYGILLIVLSAGLVKFTFEIQIESSRKDSGEIHKIITWKRFCTSSFLCFIFLKFSCAPPFSWLPFYKKTICFSNHCMGINAHRRM